MVNIFVKSLSRTWKPTNVFDAIINIKKRIDIVTLTSPDTLSRLILGLHIQSFPYLSCFPDYFLTPLITSYWINITLSCSLVSISKRQLIRQGPILPGVLWQQNIGAEDWYSNRKWIRTPPDGNQSTLQWQRACVADRRTCKVYFTDRHSITEMCIWSILSIW